MLKLNLPKTNIDLASDGRWVAFSDEISFKIAMDNNPGHKRAVQAKFKQIQKLREKSNFNRIEIINNELLVRYILKDWKGITEEGGKNLPFDEETALQILGNAEYQSIKDFIQDESREIDEYDSEVIATVKK